MSISHGYGLLTNVNVFGRLKMPNLKKEIKSFQSFYLEET